MAIVTREAITQKLRKGQGAMSLQDYAKRLGCSATYLSDIMCERRDPGPKILRLLKLRRSRTTTITYETDGRK